MRRVLPVIAVLVALATTAAGPTSPASAASSPPRTTPSCPPGSVAVAVTSAAATTRPRRAEPGVTTLPDGRTVRQVCAPGQPIPFTGPRIAPEHTVGGPALARPGVVTDLPAGIPSPPDMPHVAYVLADLDTGEILAAKAPHALLRPASTMKLFTALVVTPALDPGRIVVGAPEDAAADGTRVGIVPGNRYSVDALLDALLMVSGNDAAYALARAYGGRDRLVADMNARAAQLGAFDTVVVDPSGLDADGQRTSAYDMALVGRAALSLPEVRRRSVQATGMFPGATRTLAPVRGSASKTTVAPYPMTNHNLPFLQSYPGVVGIKNGYTSLARSTLVVAATRGGRTLLLTELGSPVQYSESTRAMLDWGFAYAAQARPVGQLVAAGTAVRPPEWGGPDRPATVATASGEPSGPPTEPSETTGSAGSGPAGAGEGSEPEPTDTVEYLLAARVSSWWGGLGPTGRLGVAAGALAAVVALAWASAWWWRRHRARPRGHFEA